MKEQIRLSFYLDSRRKKATGLYPVKLRLYQPRTTNERLHRTGFELTEAQFTQCLLKRDAAKGEPKLTRIEKSNCEPLILQILAIQEKAKAILATPAKFDFDEFENRFFDKASGRDLDYYLQQTNRQLTEEGRIRTAQSYQLALVRLKEYLNATRKKPLERVAFEDVTPATLRGFENYYLKKGYSPTSIGIYTRPIRALFNRALTDAASGVELSQYPFGKGRFTPPNGQNIKKALTPEQLRILFEAQPQNHYQQKAKDFFFFSYLANGMNFKDIAELKYKDLNGNRLSFYRSKTKNTTKETPRLIHAILPAPALAVITRYGNANKAKEEYIFNVLAKTDTPTEALFKIKSFTRFANQHLKALATAYNKHVKAENEAPTENELIPEEISTYWARHSFTTQAIRKGASMELLQESLGHKNLATTQNYFAGFTSDVKENLSKSLLDF